MAPSGEPEAVSAVSMSKRGASFMASEPAGDAIAAKEAMAPSDSQGGGDALSQERKLIKNGSISLQVNSLDKQKEAQAFVKAKATEFSVTFDREDENRWGDQATISLTASVPAEKFDAFLKSLAGGPYTVTNRSVSVSEVTQQYIDLEIRLRNKKELRERYLAILKKADKIKDILAINQSVESVTSDIESTEGQFRYLKNQVAKSTLSIQITAQLPVTMLDQNGFFQDVWQALHEGWRRMRNFTVGLVSLWPFIGLIAIGIWGFRYWRNRRKNK